jgi:hypothetical protein
MKVRKDYMNLSQKGNQTIRKFPIFKACNVQAPFSPRKGNNFKRR